MQKIKELGQFFAQGLLEGIENVNGDFCEGWNTAHNIIKNMLSDRYWKLKHQIPERTGGEQNE